MNILYVGFFSLPDKDAAANRVWNNALALSELGHNVVFIDEQKEYPFSNFLHSRRRLERFEVWSQKRPTGVLSYIKKMISISNIEEVIRSHNNIDIIIAYNYPSIALINLKRVCHKERIKLISDCTEWYSGNEYRFPFNIFCSLDSYIRMCHVHKKLDGIICISEYLFNYYKDYTNVTFIPPLVDTFKCFWRQECFPYDKNMINLVYAGNPGKNKESLLPIIEAINNSKNKGKIVLRILGITKDDFINTNGMNHYNKLNNSNILFLGKKNHNDTLRYIISSDYMVFIRRKNKVSEAGFSTKFVESISCSTSVITNNTGMLKEYIEKHKVGFIVEEDELKGLLDKDVLFLKKSAVIKNKEKLFDFRLYIDNFNELLLKL